MFHCKQKAVDGLIFTPSMIMLLIIVVAPYTLKVLGKYLEKAGCIMVVLILAS